MFVYPRVATATAGQPITSDSDASNFQFRDPEERSTKTMVKVRDGDTIVIGGLIRNDVQVTEEKIPFLGDIPSWGPCSGARAEAPARLIRMKSANYWFLLPPTS